MTPAPSMRRDLISAYAASGAKVLSWVVVSAVVFRASPSHFAVLALVRGTLTLLNYTTVGLAPAMIRLLAEVSRPLRVLPVSALDGTVLSYARSDVAELRAREPLKTVYTTALTVAGAAAGFGAALAVSYGNFLAYFHDIPAFAYQSASTAAVVLGFGVVFRLFSDAPAALVQTKGSIAVDNVLLIGSELIWVTLTLALSPARAGAIYPADGTLMAAAGGYAASGLLLLIGRFLVASRIVPLAHVQKQFIDPSSMRRLVVLGLAIAAAQVADFLYAPTDYILINRLLSAELVAAYAPAVQIDSGLLLAVAGLSAVLLPKAALAHAAGDVARIRRYYVRGTLGSVALLAVSGVGVYWLSDLIFRLWLRYPLAETTAIFPLVLIHTVVGGSSGVGRSILLGMGKVKPFAAAALLSGALNVVLSFVFVKYFGLGLKGIVYGTIVAVVARCVVWQPWYVLRTLRREAAATQSNLAPAAAAAAAAVVVPPPGVSP